jgi:hypothetical protein
LGSAFSCDDKALQLRFEKLHVFIVDASPSPVYSYPGLQGLFNGCTHFFQLAPAEASPTASFRASSVSD